MNVFIMPFLSADCGPWSRMSRARPAMSAITTPSGSTFPSHQESRLGAVEAIREKVIEETERALLSRNVRNFVEHIYKCFLSVLS